MSRVLVVEDYPPLATVLAIGVGRLGHVVLRVGSVQRARAAEGQLDAAIIDIDLPDGSGIDLAEELVTRTPAPAIVFYTSCRDAALRARAERLGPVVDKSQPLEELLHVVSELLSGEVALQRASGATDPPPAPRSSPSPSPSGMRPRVR